MMITRTHNEKWKRILVCGGRTYSDWERVKYVLDCVRPTIEVIIQGGAKGADALAKQWAKERHLPCEEFLADWSKYGKRAGHLRNTQMLVAGKPDLVIAFPGGKGTANMIAQAKAANVYVLEVPLDYEDGDA